MFQSIAFTVCLFWSIASSGAITLKTTAPSTLSAAQLQDFISRPANWPDIVASSNSVESATKNNDPSLPLKRGVQVTEYFGLNLLSVDWICRQASPGRLEVESPKGLEGIADQCAMRFDFQDHKVTLEMEYNPLSPLALLAMPVLIVDNWIALNVLLPAAVDQRPLDSFRKLMGTLYGFAGMAHLVDILGGGSVLFQTAGIPVFSALEFTGKAFALLWCAAGPLAFWATHQQQKRIGEEEASLQWLPDASLAFYGLVEVAGVFLGHGTTEAMTNAVVVQVIVLAAWIYSSQKRVYDFASHE